MKKIDLHLHTIASAKDADFEFNLEMFQEYIDQHSIDAIAITNHNLFNLIQFEEITQSLQNVSVFPGIEIDFERGHLLLISERENLQDFEQKCSLITEELDSEDYISISRLKSVFGDLNNYLLIPHYDKKPKVGQSVIDTLNEYIFSGEVQSPKKFNRLIKSSINLTPVLFSDARISANLDLEKQQGKQTFIKTTSDPLTIASIKAALKDNKKVFLTNEGKQGFFQVFGDGQILSNGLNVVIGGRSSGKTFLLDRLQKIFDIDKRLVKYIKQFDLVKEDEEKFNEIVEKEKSATREKYLQEFQIVVENVLSIDRRNTSYKTDKFIDTLVEYATSEKLHDEFSNSVLFAETPFPIRDNESLENVINSVHLLSVSTEFRIIIDKYIPEHALGNLLIELKNKFEEITVDKLKKKWVNELVNTISQKLKHKTSSPTVQFNDIDFYKLKIEKIKIKKFNAIAGAIKIKKTIEENTSFDKFKIQTIASAYEGAGELRQESRKQIAFSSAFQKYDSPIDFLEELKAIESLEKSELYKYFSKVTCQVLNKYGKRVSGGERAEFNLLKALQDARQYEMLLIDEPESSFDNLFLKESVNKEIKELSTELPVVVVTHNNTVGMLMNPDYILYLRRDIIAGKDEYSIYSGSLGDKEFKTAGDGKTVDSYATLLDTLEAGETAYIDRKSLYDNFKK